MPSISVDLTGGPTWRSTFYTRLVRIRSAGMVGKPAALDDSVLVVYGPQPAADRGISDSPWLFPGYTPGQHLNGNHLADALSEHGTPPRAGRIGTWRQLLPRVAPSVLADDLGISAMTAMKHAQLAGSDYLRYAGGRSHTSHQTS